MRRRFTNNRVSDIPFDYSNYMTIEALEDGVAISLPYEIREFCQYGVDGIGWKPCVVVPTINYGQKISFKCDISQTNFTQFGNINISGSCKLCGNCLSLIFGDNAINNTDISAFPSIFQRLFYRQSSIKEVSSNFLPATMLAKDCYYRMFENCKSLTIAPELPATTLASNCYYDMFYGCTKLNYIKMLAVNISAVGCLGNWVYGVASNGTFVKNPAMTTLPTGESGIPSGWTVQNA